MRPSGSPEVLEQRRQKAINLLEQGLMPVEVAERLDVERRSVRRWKAAYRTAGQAGLKARPAPGRPSRLATTDKTRLEKWLLKGAKAAGFSTDLWTCPRIAKFIQDHFGIRYHVDHICKLLHNMGWSPQRPARVAVERNERIIQHWLKVQWPQIKKKPAG